MTNKTYQDLNRQIAKGKKHQDPRGQAWRVPTSGHKCGWPGCEEFIAGRLWGCREHWLLIPVELRDAYMAAGSGKPGPYSCVQDKPLVKLVDQEIKLWVIAHEQSS